MTPPLDQPMLRAQMETLAKEYVQVRAFAIDSLVTSASLPVPWDAVHQKCNEVAGSIHKTINLLVEVYHLLKDQS